MKLTQRMRTAAIPDRITPKGESRKAIYAATLIHSSTAMLLLVFVLVLFYTIPG